MEYIFTRRHQAITWRMRHWTWWRPPPPPPGPYPRLPLLPLWHHLYCFCRGTLWPTTLIKSNRKGYLNEHLNWMLFWPPAVNWGRARRFSSFLAACLTMSCHKDIFASANKINYISFIPRSLMLIPFNTRLKVRMIWWYRTSQKVYLYNTFELLHNARPHVDNFN